METITPDLFHIDYGRLTEVLITIVVLSFIIERALSVIFESKVFIDWSEAKRPLPEIKNDSGITIQQAAPGKPKKAGIREMIAAVVSIVFCFSYDFDAITIILQSSDHMSVGGTIITGLVISGGSKVSQGLFQDVMGFMSTAEAQRKGKN